MGCMRMHRLGKEHAVRSFAGPSLHPQPYNCKHVRIFHRRNSKDLIPSVIPGVRTAHNSTGDIQWTFSEMSGSKPSDDHGNKRMTPF